MRIPTLLSALVLAFASTVGHSDELLPCDTSYATHETVSAGTTYVVSCFLSEDVAMYNLELFLADPNLGAIIDSVFTGYNNANAFTNVECGPCPWPDECAKSVGSYQVVNFGAGIEKIGDMWCVVVFPRQDVELSMRCLECSWG